MIDRKILEKLKLNLTSQSIIASIRSKPVLHRLAHGTFWVLLGTAASRVFSLTSTIVIAKLLGVTDFGAYGMVQSTLEMFGLFAGLSLGATSTKYLAEYKAKDKRKASRILSLTSTFAGITSASIAMVIYLGAPWIAGGVLMRGDLAPLLSMGAIYLFISTQNNVQIGSLGGFEAFRETAKINTLQGILTPIFAIPLVYLYNLEGAVLSMIAVSLVGYIFSRIEIKKQCRKFNIELTRFTRASFDEWPIIWRFSVPSFVSGLLLMPVVWFTNALLVNQPNGYAELGLFNAANQWRQLIIFIPQILSTVMLPMLSEAFGDHKKESFMQALRVNLVITWVISLPMTTLIIAIRNPLSELFGKNFAGMEILIIILMTTAFLNILNAVIGTALAGSGRMWLGTMMNLLWAIVLILSAYSLVPLYGGLGLACAYLIAYCLHTCWVMVYADMYLAHRLIRAEKELIIITALTILPTMTLAYLNALNMTSIVFILLISLIPFGRLLRKEYGKAVSH